jgi:hypothetical protein
MAPSERCSMYHDVCARTTGIEIVLYFCTASPSGLHLNDMRDYCSSEQKNRNRILQSEASLPAAIIVSRLSLLTRTVTILLDGQCKQHNKISLLI